MQSLPAKDQAVFRSIVKFYETKQYKKGVKAADSILKKHPDHGETLCMKGLTLSYLDKKEEAYELVRRGLKHDLRSHVCWHVFGLLYRQDRDYFEAVKCYRNALRIDPDNIQILRDLSLLQIHRRDLTGFAETRRKLLQVKPSNRLNWVGYAVAEHLCQSYEFSWSIIDNYEKTFKDESVAEYETSELYLYKATIMEEAGKFEEALECLRQHDKDIVDKLGSLEMKGRLCMFLQRYAEASEHYGKLVKMNSEHHVYILAYMASQPQFHRFWPALPAPKVGEQGDSGELPLNIQSFSATVHPEGMPISGWLPPPHALKSRRWVDIGARQYKRRVETYEPVQKLTDEEEESVCKFFDELRETYPKSDSVQRLLLYFISGKRFQRRLDNYLRSRFRKGIPSLFRIIRPLYFQEGKPALIQDLLAQYLKHLQEDIAWFGPEVGDEAAKPPESFEDEESPSVILFVLMVVSEHHEFMGDTTTALKYIDEAIEHTPTCVELYASKARIYKRAGNLRRAADLLDEVRCMDLADRFLNTQCVRGLMRVDDVETGMEKALMFSHSKEPDSADASNLHDMQAMWFESAVGRSYYRQENYGKALKEFTETFRHFHDISEDQFDFHNYCLRKTTLKAYVGMLRMQERLYSHKFYRRAGKDALKIYFELYDRKARGEPYGASAEAESVELSAEDKRKQKHKNKREKKKVDDEQEKKAATTPGGKPKKVDDDPDGKKLLEKDPMEEASKIAKNLVLYSSQDMTSHALTYEVFSRQKKFLHCLQALIRMFELSGRDVANYKLANSLAHFCFAAKLDSEDTPPVVREVILSELPVIFGSETAFASFDELRAAANKTVDSLERRLKDEGNQLPVIVVLYGLRTLKHAGRDCRGFLDQWSPKGALELKQSKKMLSYLASEFGKDSSIWQRVKDRCIEVFPMMVVD